MIYFFIDVIYILSTQKLSKGSTIISNEKMELRRGYFGHVTILLQTVADENNAC